MQRFKEAGIRPKTQHGQNFLVDLNLLDLLFNSGDVGPDDVVLEVGCGTGALTIMLASQAAHVVTVEIDRQLIQIARQQLEHKTNYTLLVQDALKNKNKLSPELIETVRTHLAAAPGRQFKLVANLPYNVATPIISNLLLLEPRPVSMTVTIQKELGERMAAQPSTKDYSALSIWIQSQCDVEIVRIMPPQAFWPPPKVESAIVHITPRDDLRARIRNVPFFHAFVRSMFFHRRKFLRKNLIAAFKDRLEKEDIDQILEAIGYPPETRAEELSVEQMIGLADTFCQAVGDMDDVAELDVTEDEVAEEEISEEIADDQ